MATDANAVLGCPGRSGRCKGRALRGTTAEYGGDTLNVDEIKQAEVKIVGVDSDAESIEVTITDSLGNEAQLSATYTDGDGWTVAPEDLSGLADGMVTVDATLTDDAGNKTVSTDTFTKDTVVEPAAVLNVSVANAMMTAEEAENVTVSAESGAGWTVTLTGSKFAAAMLAQADVAAATVVKTGIGTGSAQVISLDAADLAALGDGQVTVESTATDLAGNTASASTSFDLDTTADAEDGIDLTVTVDSVINDAESGNVTLTLSGVDADAVSVSVTLTDGTDSVSATAESLTTTVPGR